MSSPPFDDSAFDRDTELVPSAGGELRGSLSEHWLAGRGPHGGYVAALILRGLTMVVHRVLRVTERALIAIRLGDRQMLRGVFDTPAQPLNLAAPNQGEVAERLKALAC
jgi:hypothetical protein